MTPEELEAEIRAAGHDIEAGRKFAAAWRRLSRPDASTTAREEDTPALPARATQHNEETTK